MSEHLVDDAGRDDALMDHHSTIVVAGAMLTGLVLRLANLGTQPLWLDEAATAANVRILREHGLAALAQADHMPPLSFAIQMISTAHVMNEVTLRFPSAFAGVLAILFVHLAAVRINGSPTVGAWAAVFMAVSPFAVWYSQEARMYSFLILLAAIYVWVCWPALSRDLSPLRALSILLVTVAGLYVHHYFALLMLVMGCWLVIKLTLRSRVVWWWLLIQSYKWEFGPKLETMLKVSDGYAYIFAMPGGTSGQRTFSLPGGIAADVEVIGEGRSISIRDGRFSDTFAAQYTYHIYRIRL